MAETLFKHWESYRSGNDHRNDRCSYIKNICDKELFEAYKKKAGFLYFSANNLLEKMSEKLPDESTGYALFSSESCLLKLYGSESFLLWCRKHSITPGTIWDKELIGVNAVPIAKEFNQPITTGGVESCCDFLSSVAIHFCPVTLHGSLETNSHCGGIAILTPLDNDNPYLPLLCYANAREICMRSFWHVTSKAYTNVSSGLLSIIQSNNKHYLLFANDRLFKELNIPIENLSFIDLEEIVEPLPANKGFWHIVNGRTEAENVPVRLKCRWGEVAWLMTSKLMVDPVSRMNYMIIFLQSSRRSKNPVSHDPFSNVNYSFTDIQTKNKQFDDMLHYAKAASNSESSILLLGESGSGKDVIAQAIHRESPRKDKPFVALNCAAFSKELISSELFGYEEGSFTGAARGGTMGKFELANNGTLFLDEIGDMPLDLQTTLLRVLEAKSFMKVGGNKLIHVNVRIIAATNQDLREKIHKKLFREDLYYRLGVIRLTVPPLRERKEDIVPLAEYFVNMICKQIGKEPFMLDVKAKQFLESYTWPGNIRELKNMIEGIVNIYNGPVIESSQVTGYLFSNINGSTPRVLQRSSESYRVPAGVRPSKEDISAALMKTRGNKVETAKTLGISRRTLYRRLAEFGLL
jgi:sigma-54 dependent transcriptional regulator, acetoin dehydrogenase operon transcriptional activator AcoR